MERLELLGHPTREERDAVWQEGTLFDPAPELPPTQPVVLSPPPLPFPVFPVPATQPVQPLSQLLGMELPPVIPEEVMDEITEVGALCWGPPSSHAIE
jgi:hypothetical protein